MSGQRRAEIITDLKASTVVASVEREDRDAPAVVIHDEDIGFEINADMGMRSVAAERLERVAWTLLAVAEELRGGPAANDPRPKPPINALG